MEFSYGIAYQTSNGFFSEQFEADFLSPNVMTECVHGPLILSLRLEMRHEESHFLLRIRERTR